MRLQTKVFTLVALSVAGQALVFGGFAILDERRTHRMNALDLIERDRDMVRDLQAGFTELSSQVSAAAITGARGELEMVSQRGGDLASDARSLGRYGAARSVTALQESYWRSLDKLMENIPEGAPRSAPFAFIMDLRTKQEYCAKSLRALRDEIGIAVERERDSGNIANQRERAAFYSLAGAYLAFLLSLAYTWAKDLKTAFGLLRRDLVFVGKGAVPPAHPPRADEVGQTLHVLRRMAQQARGLRENITHWDRLAAMGQLAGGVAHEINNPLVGVLGRAELLLEKLPANDASRTHVEHIFNSAERCRKIIRNLLNFARPQSQEFAEVNLKEVWDAVMDMTGADLRGAGIEVESDLSAQLPKVWGNATELTEVLMNLAINARDAMPYGGKLILQSECADSQYKGSDKHTACVTAGQVSQRPPEEASWLHVTLKDTGIGMSPETMRKLFEAFYTTKEPGKGTGLGLSVCAGIIRKHGGLIVAESNGQGKGSLFTISLPVHKGMISHG